MTEPPQNPREHHVWLPWRDHLVLRGSNPARGKINRFNDGLALHATLIFGSMWITYVFFLYGFLPVFFPSAEVTLLYWSNTVQLWSLPLLMVGANVIGRAAEQRAVETHDAVMEELAGMRELVAELHSRAGAKGGTDD